MTPDKCLDFIIRNADLMLLVTGDDYKEEEPRQFVGYSLSDLKAEFDYIREELSEYKNIGIDVFGIIPGNNDITIGTSKPEYFEYSEDFLEYAKRFKV